MSNALPKAGFSFLRVLLLFVLFTAVGAGTHFYVQQKKLARQCFEHLHRIYAALEMHEIERGTLPNLAFFPDDPKQDPDSLVTALAPYESAPEMFVCPTAPPSHAELGLTYVWNIRMNSKKLQQSNPPEWVLVEINALSADVPASHLGKYHILYSDGTVQASSEPPPGLRDL
jgi:hypothetical protein